jgi:hypothetical protein
MPKNVKLTTRFAFERILAGEELSEEEFEELLDLKEDQYLDFKSGKLSENEKKFKKTIRQWVSGFANAQGGLLVIGPEDKDRRRIVPARYPKEKTQAEWLGSTLSGLPFLFPFPRIVTQSYRGKDVLFVATMRTTDLVPYVEGTVWKFFFRMGHETKQVPNFLVEDLKLGRRSHPALELYFRNTSLNPSPQKNYCSAGFDFRVENVGMTTAEDVFLGIIAWDAQLRGPDDRELEKLVPNKHLRSFFDSEIPVFEEWGDHNLVHRSSRRTRVQTTVYPFSSERIFGGGHFTYWCSPAKRVKVTSKAAVYVMVRGHPPIWYQMEFAVLNNCRGCPGEWHVTEPVLERLHEARAIVSLEYQVADY